MNIDHMISSFLVSFSHADFPHSEEVVRLLANFKTLAPRVSVSTARVTDEMRSGYRFRAEMAAKNPSSRSPNLAADVLALARTIEEARDQPIRSWWIPVEGGRVYLVFELIEDARIAGCLETYDAREIGVPE